jgi:hypothetical protein
VAQAPSDWQHLIDRLQSHSLPKSPSKSRKSLVPSQFRGIEVGLVGSSAAVILLMWDWKLLLSTSAGILGMMAAYSLQQRDWRKLRVFLRQFLSSSNRPLAVSAIGGGLAAIASYMAFSVWTGTDNPWIASSEILQSAGIIGILALLAIQNARRYLGREEIKLDRAISHLMDSDPLKRLIAVRQMTQLVREERVAKAEQRDVSDYFRLMLGRESEPIVRDAILEGMQVLREVNSLPPGTPAMPKLERKYRDRSNPRSANPRPVNLRRHSVEEMQFNSQDDWQ